MVDNPTKIYNDYVRANLPNSMSYDTGTDRYDINSHSFFKFKNSNWYFNYISKYGYSALSAYAVNNFEPALVFDFKGNYFRKSATASTFPASITHAASTNATMTDGYGPEVVTNGKFGTDTAGWVSGPSAATSAAVSGEMQVTNVSSYGRVITAIPTVVGRQYEVSGVGRVISGAGVPAASLYLTNSAGSTIQAGTVNYTNTDAPLGLFFTATATTSYISAITFGNVGNVSAFDNVSVRQSPVLKWRPHNLITKSNTFDTWSKDFSTVTANNATGPDGVANTADTITFNATTNNVYNLAFSPFSAGDKATIALWVRSDTLTTLQISFNGRINPANNALGGTVAVTSTWALVSVEATVVGNDTGLYFILGRNISLNPATVGTFEAYGAHMFRSNLGGMVNNPDRGDSYVPTTTTPVYLSRRGQHHYNGSAWVNEGILHESEARTNLLPTSSVLGYSKIGVVTSTPTVVSPSGLQDAVLVRPVVPSGVTWVYYPTIYNTGVVTTISTFAKASGKSFFTTADSNGTVKYASFNLTTGAVGTVASGYTANMEDFGNGWYRCSVTTPTGFNERAIYAVSDTDGAIAAAANGNDGILLYGAQLEAGSTPSSYIPTTGSASVTRAADTLTVPAANLPYNSTNMSIQMDGKMTYADTGISSEVEYYRWLLDGINYINSTVQAYSSKTGEPVFSQRDSATALDSVVGSGNTYAPDTNVPFNFAVRHGSTFINAANEGTLLTANTTPTALPNLSSNNLTLGFDFMGTIGEFRMWSDDLGDVGITEATLPSTEPSLSLTFDGSETSFIVLDWSE
jgi:hypothetical protein